MSIGGGGKHSRLHLDLMDTRKTTFFSSGTAELSLQYRNIIFWLTSRLTPPSSFSFGPHFACGQSSPCNMVNVIQYHARQNRSPRKEGLPSIYHRLSLQDSITSSRQNILPFVFFGMVGEAEGRGDLLLLAHGQIQMRTHFDYTLNIERARTRICTPYR